MTNTELVMLAKKQNKNQNALQFAKYLAEFRRMGFKTDLAIAQCLADPVISRSICFKQGTVRFDVNLSVLKLMKKWVLNEDKIPEKYNHVARAFNQRMKSTINNLKNS
jgi:hypothetical protein